MKPALVIIVGIAALALAPQAGATDDLRIEGTVRDTRVTYCDATRLGGCAGILTLAPAAAGGPALVINVPLGTPISRAGEHVLLQSLDGLRVIITQHGTRGGRVARAIEVTDPPAAEAAVGGTRDAC